jgi:hypothetical protein
MGASIFWTILDFLSMKNNFLRLLYARRMLAVWRPSAQEELFLFKKENFSFQVKVFWFQ